MDDDYGEAAEMAYDAYEELREERDALKAEVERLREEMGKMIRPFDRRPIRVKAHQDRGEGNIDNQAHGLVDAIALGMVAPRKEGR